MSYLTVSTDGFLNNINNEIAFPEQEVSVLKYLHFQIFQSHLSFSVDHNDNIMELVNEWLPNGNFRKVDTPFRKESA